MWLNKYQLMNPKDSAELEKNSAIYQFHKGLARELAEAKAYEDYKKEKQMEAAAYHLAGMKMAQGAGDMEACKKHGMLYDMHMKSMGLDPYNTLSKDFIELVNKVKPTKYKFSSHKADIFAIKQK